MNLRHADSTKTGNHHGLKGWYLICMEHAPKFLPVHEQYAGPAERIAQAALFFKGKLYTAAHHDDALYQLGRDYPDWQDKYADEIREGFTTNTGRFVDRNEAKNIADKADQLLQSMSENRRNDAELDSYDINIEEKPEYPH